MIVSSPAPLSANSVISMWRLSCHRPETFAFSRVFFQAVTLPLTNPVEKPVMSRDQILALLRAIDDLHDAARHSIRGPTLSGRVKSKASKAPIPVAEQVRPVIEAWKRYTSDSSPEALMFPTFGRGQRKGQIVPHSSKNFLQSRIRPIARRLGIPDRLVTFQVMRRTLGTDMQKHGSLKDTQGALRHASITTTRNVYVQVIDESVLKAVNSRTNAVLDGWTGSFADLRRTGRQPKVIAGKRVSMKFSQVSQPGGRRSV
jgi:integrase